MTTRTIITEPNKILRQVSEPVESVGKEEQKIMDEAIDRIREKMDEPGPNDEEYLYKS